MIRLVFFIFIFSFSALAENQDIFMDKIKTFAVEHGLLTADDKFELDHNPDSTIYKKYNLEKIEIINPLKKKISLHFIDNDRQKKKAILATITKLIKVPVVKDNMKKGSIISDADLTIAEFPDKVRKNCVIDKNTLIGKQASKPIKALRPISSDSIVNPILIKKNSSITVLYKKDNNVVKMSGISKDNGRLNDNIRVLNPRTGKLIYAEVISHNTAEIPSKN